MRYEAGKKLGNEKTFAEDDFKLELNISDRDANKEKTIAV